MYWDNCKYVYLFLLVPTENPPSKTRIIPERIENPPIFRKEAPKTNAEESKY